MQLNRRFKIALIAISGLLAFALLFLPHLLTDECGEYHRALAGELDLAVEPGRRLLGALPREHGKTTIGTVALTLREICVGAKKNILLVAANREEASAKLRLIVNELESNSLIREVFARQIAPARDKKGHTVAYGDSEIVLADGARVSTLGFGGKVRGQLASGRRLDLIILDDPEDDESVASPQQRRKLRAWVDHALINALDVASGSLVWLGTLLHHDCVLAQCMASHGGGGVAGGGKPAAHHLPMWPFIKYAAISDAGDPLWPGRWSKERLRTRRFEIGDKAFSQEFLNKPVSLIAQVFRDGDFCTYDPGTLACREGQCSVAGGDPLTVVIGVDPAIGEGSQHDYFAAVVVGIAAEEGSKGARVYILEVYCARIRFAEQLERLSELARRYLPRRIGIESTAYQAALMQAAWDRGLPAQKLGGVRPKMVRIEAAAVHVAQRRVFLPVEGSWVAQFRKEAADYPAGRHDDQLDAFARALECGLPLVNGGGGVLTGGGKRSEYEDIGYAGGKVRLTRF